MDLVNVVIVVERNMFNLLKNCIKRFLKMTMIIVICCLNWTTYFNRSIILNKFLFGTDTGADNCTNIVGGFRIQE